MNSVSNLRLALDMYVLGQGVKTGVYRVCDELFPRLACSSLFAPLYYMRKGFETIASSYIADHQLSGCLITELDQKPSNDADILLSPFGVAPCNWLNDPNILHAHIIYDLIAIRMPHFFSHEASMEVHNIIASLNEHTVIFAISEYTKQDLLAYRPDLKPNQVTVIPLAAGDNFKPCHDEKKKTEVRERYGVPHDVPYVLSLATLEIRKNLDQVVKAFIRYLDQNSDSHLHLVLSGMTGWKLEQLNQALETAGKWRNRIVLTGFVDDTDLSALYSGATCFIYLSRYEGFGLPPLEAMACGTPVISSNNSSLPEVVGEAGIMFDADDIEAVAKAIQQITSSDDYRTELSAKGIERAKLFSWNKCASIVAETLITAHEVFANQSIYPPRKSLKPSTDLNIYLSSLLTSLAKVTRKAVRLLLKAF